MARCLLVNRWGFIPVIVFIICSGVNGLAQSRRFMGDPLFAISYDPQNVRFESLPASLISKCPELQGRYTQAWVYGQLKTADSEYFLIAGLMQYHDEATGAPTSIAPEEDGGLVIALRGRKCLVDQEDYFFDQKVNPARGATPITAPRMVLIGILQDALRRDADAFGGKQAFLKLVHRDAIGPPLVREQLELYDADLAKSR